jgi:hypothetical protein
MSSRPAVHWNFSSYFQKPKVPEKRPLLVSKFLKQVAKVNPQVSKPDFLGQKKPRISI